MSDQLPELTPEEKAALDSIDMTEILGTPAERLQFALDKAVQFMREKNVAKASEKMAWAEHRKLQAMLDERTLQHQTQLDNAVRLEQERDRWKSEHLRLTNELERLQQRDVERENKQLRYEQQQARNLLRETFFNPGPTWEYAGNISNPFAYFDKPRWEWLKKRCRALLGEGEPSKDI